MGKPDFITAMLCRMRFPQNSISSVRYLFCFSINLKDFLKQPVLNLTRYIGSITIEYVMTDIGLY